MSANSETMCPKLPLLRECRTNVLWPARPLVMLNSRDDELRVYERPGGACSTSSTISRRGAKPTPMTNSSRAGWRPPTDADWGRLRTLLRDVMIHLQGDAEQLEQAEQDLRAIGGDK